MPSRLGSALRRLRGTNHPLAAASEHLATTNAQTLRWQAEITRIAAPTGNETARGAWLATQFHHVGWTTVHTDAVGNVIARRPSDVPTAGRAPEVWCCAHLDTVFTEPAPVVTHVGNRLTGPGIGDNGRGLAALLALAQALSATSLRTPHDIAMICTVGEEGLGDLRGMKHLLTEASPLPSAVIAIDGAGDDRIVNRALGSTRWRVVFSGAGGHSWADYGVANPVHAASAVAAALQAVLLPREPRTTLTVSRIGGGESINSIPRDAFLEVDIRSQSADVLEGLGRTLQETVTRVVGAENRHRTPTTAPLTVRVEQIGNRPSGYLADDAPLVRLAKRATRSVGAVPRLSVGSTDASVPIAWGIPAIAIGAGGQGGGTHTPEEWYDDSDGIRGLQRALRIVTEAAGLR